MRVMKRFWLRFALGAALAAGCGLSHAQADVGLVNLVAGDVAFTPQGGKPGRVTAFMKVRESDRFELPSGAQVRIVYFESARQERWQGPASFRATRRQGAAISGSPSDVTALPAGVPQRLARVPELVQNAKLGGIQVRGMPTRKPADEALDEAKATYARLSKELPADDITPELYFYSALNDYQMHDEMATVVAEMRRKQPNNQEVLLLDDWLKRRRGQ
jgi:hypothetical protein